MKKNTFYSFMFMDNKKQAVKHEGYTDGTYNYYKSENYCNTWYAVEPLTGLSVVNAPTRKEAAAQAHKLTEKVKERISNMQAVIDEFTRYRAEAKTTEV